MRKIIITLLFFNSVLMLKAQVQELNRLGQLPGGFGWHVNYDSTSKRLFVGCGTSVWVYDASNTTSAQTIKVIAKRPLLGTVNETDLYGNVLFAAATHDGVYALDVTSDSLTILAHYQIQNDTAAYDMWRTNDTLYIATGQKIHVLKYSPGNFTHITTFGVPGAFCVTRKGNYIAVGSQGYPKGTISIYNVNNLTTPVVTWQHNKIWNVQDLQFADLRNDVLYICGGAEDLLFSKSNLFAIQFTGSSVTAVDSFTVSGGILNYAQMDILNMDSRNDTLFVATTAAYNSTTYPYAYAAIIDASHFPADTLHEIGFYVPGLWHFDVALMRGTPFIATSSEWLGVCINNISQLQPGDTLGFLETGGYGIKSQIKHDTLWVAQEGYGLAAYKLDSLYYRNGYMCKSRILHLFKQFVLDFDFINDSLIVMTSAKGDIYNIKPWLSGHNPVKQDSLGIGSIEKVKTIQTNNGVRIVGGWDNALSPPKAIMLFNPFSTASPHSFLDSIQTGSNVYALTVTNDTLYCGKKYGNNFYLAAYKIYNDSFTLIDTIAAPSEINCIAVENGIIAIGCIDYLLWFQLNNNTFIQKGSYFDWYIRPQGLVLRNKNLYVADKMFGLRVFSLASLTQAVLVAECKGTKGWVNLFGSNTVNVGNDGKIYLSDQHAGVIIIDAYDTAVTSITDKQNISDSQIFQMFPNPANLYTTIKFTLPKDEIINLKLSDITGKEISAVKNEKMQKGEHAVSIDTHDIQSGLYFLQLITEQNIRAEKIEIIK